MNWQAFILLHALFSALQTIQFRAVARDKAARHAGLAVNAIAFTALYICGLVVLPLLGNVSFDEFRANWNMFVTAGGLFVVALYFMYKGLTHLESATASVLGTSAALFVVVFARIFYGEQLSTPQIIGVALLLPCIWYVLLLAKRHKKIINFKDTNWLHGFYYMIGSSFCLAMAHIVERDILQSASLATYVAYGWALQLAWAWALVLLFGSRARKALKNQKLVRGGLQLGVLRAATGIFFLKALMSSGSVSLVTVVANFRIIIVAVLAGWLLGERKFYYKKLAAAALSVVALSIIFWN